MEEKREIQPDEDDSGWDDDEPVLINDELETQTIHLDGILSHDSSTPSDSEPTSDDDKFSVSKWHEPDFDPFEADNSDDIEENSDNVPESDFNSNKPQKKKGIMHSLGKLGKKVDKFTRKIGETVVKIGDSVGKTVTKIGDSVGKLGEKVGDKFTDSFSGTISKIGEKKEEKKHRKEEIKKELEKINASWKNSPDNIEEESEEWEDLSVNAYNVRQKDKTPEDLILDRFDDKMKELYADAQEYLEMGQESMALSSFELITREAEKMQDDDILQFVKQQIDKIY
jgi:hypothetical protein